ncbi:hypothetical protein WICANDRAFT_86188 [Wickerhamomyces anomalus NRRL Y-366-8]|uniref:Uncharacterized protein n=1 Tax=Wickerhamomyces anomalus (strain ATCC 58044 / CBS 1984 / NCYC 433 / NRRL Y-366-8) TaxID=683960 RepID=A0A1E3NXQ5_WICAA|nr:uncharacterized protein WICANDRAFT_86188 [Wickerhamomyces anomalus NRRL Y-366-8]ODQ57337.1 hypothetical protein WICANDRAFT_86188 [Wickerhamomyces anomalus NRRL Y-366-8]
MIVEKKSTQKAIMKFGGNWQLTIDKLEGSLCYCCCPKSIQQLLELTGAVKMNCY